MNDDKKQMGILIEQGRWMAREISELKSDVKMLVSWRWRLYGANAIIAIICSSLFSILIAAIEKH